MYTLERHSTSWAGVQLGYLNSPTLLQADAYPWYYASVHNGCSIPATGYKQHGTPVKNEEVINQPDLQLLSFLVFIIVYTLSTYQYDRIKPDMHSSLK